MSMEKLLNIDDLSQILGVTKATIYAWTSKNKIPYIKIGKRLLKFREKDIEDWLSRKSVNTEISNSVRSNEKYHNRSKAKSKLPDSFIDRLINRAKADVLK